MISMVIMLSFIYSPVYATNDVRDKLEIVSQDGNFKWRLIGRIMADYNGIDSDKVKLGSGWELRRARLGMDVTLWKHWTGKVEADFAVTICNY